MKAPKNNITSNYSIIAGNISAFHFNWSPTVLVKIWVSLNQNFIYDTVNIC